MSDTNSITVIKLPPIRLEIPIELVIQHGTAPAADLDQVDLRLDDATEPGDSGAPQRRERKPVRFAVQVKPEAPAVSRRNASRISIDGEGAYTIKEAMAKMGWSKGGICGALKAGRQLLGHSIRLVGSEAPTMSPRPSRRGQGSKKRFSIDGEGSYSGAEVSAKLQCHSSSVYFALKHSGMLKGHSLKLLSSPATSDTEGE